jgi:hypothetical protein
VKLITAIIDQQALSAVEKKNTMPVGQTEK